MRLLKHSNVDTDNFDGDLILMNLDSRQVVVLNSAGSILWDALDVVNTRDQLFEILKESLPTIDDVNIYKSLDEIINNLVACGILTQQIVEHK